MARGIAKSCPAAVPQIPFGFYTEGMICQQKTSPLKRFLPSLSEPHRQNTTGHTETSNR